jgi:hypothetical protein
VLRTYIVSPLGAQQSFGHGGVARAQIAVAAALGRCRWHYSRKNNTFELLPLKNISMSSTLPHSGLPYALFYAISLHFQKNHWNKLTISKNTKKMLRSFSVCLCCRKKPFPYHASTLCPAGIPDSQIMTDGPRP